MAGYCQSCSTNPSGAQARSLQTLAVCKLSQGARCSAYAGGTEALCGPRECKRANPACDPSHCTRRWLQVGVCGDEAARPQLCENTPAARWLQELSAHGPRRCMCSSSCVHTPLRFSSVDMLHHAEVHDGRERGREREGKPPSSNFLGGTRPLLGQNLVTIFFVTFFVSVRRPSGTMHSAAQLTETLCTTHNALR